MRRAALALRLATAMAAGVIAFYLIARFVPGLHLQAGRSIPRILVILITAGVIAALLPPLARALRLRPGWSRATFVIVGEAVLLVAIAILAQAIGVLFLIGDFPKAIGLRLIGPLVVGSLLLAVTSIVGDAASVRVADRIETNIRPAVVTGDRRRLAVFAIFLLSGAAGLMYEVVWARQLVLVFGNTTQAVSAILTGYFGGLSIGSVIGGRIADRVRRPLRLYGALEIVLVAVVLVTPLLFRGLHELYRAGYASLADAPIALGLVRYVLALLALAPATILMGATLPTLSRHLSRHRAELGTAFGRLYAMNTIGAIAGTLVAGFVLIEIVGLTGTLIVGAVCSATAGVAAILIDRRSARPTPAGIPAASPLAPAHPPAIRADATDPLPGPARAFDRRRLALVVAFVSGATSLGYQLLWTRLLASGSGNTTYVFTLILTVFLVGIAAGAAIVSRRMTTLRAPVAVLGVMQLVIAAIVLAGLVVLSGLLPDLPFLVRVLLVVLPATLALGITLPLASSLVGGEDEGIGRDAGLLLGANTLGAIGGTFVVPFVFIPAIGSSRTLVLLALVNVGVGIGLLLRGRDVAATGRRVASLVATALAAVAIVALIVPNAFVADPGANHLRLESGLLSSAEDEIAAVQAGGPPNHRRLLVGGTGMTLVSVDAKLMAYLPLMTHPDAQRMLVIAFGMGSAYRAGLISGLDVDGVELVPSVPSMFGYFYDDAASVLANPRGRMFITDGRNYVELSDQTYDIVIVDPPPPIESSGTSVLYSREFYAASARRLRPGGVMMEWMPYAQSVDEFRSHVATFADLFPNVVIAFAPQAEGVYMLGSAAPIHLDPANVRATLARPGVLDDLASTFQSPAATLDDWNALIDRLVWISGGQVAAFAKGARLILDDRPQTEYFLLRRTFGPRSPRMNEPNLRRATPPAVTGAGPSP